MHKHTKRLWAQHSMVWLTCLILMIVLGVSGTPAVTAAPVHQDDPVTQCAQGVRFFRDNQLTEALPLMEAGYASRETARFSNPDELGFCALFLGIIRDGISDRAGALEAYQVALGSFQVSHNSYFEGTTLTNLGGIYEAQGRHIEALKTYEQALAIWHEMGERFRTEEGDTINNIGLIYHYQGQYDKALEQYKQALEIAHEVSDREGEGTTLNNIGGVYADQGRYVAALDAFTQALKILRAVVGRDSRAMQGTTLNSIGFSYFSQGRYGEALASYEQALGIRREINDRAGEGTTLNNIGLVYFAQGQYDKVLAMYKQSLMIMQTTDSRAGQGIMLNNIGQVYVNQGHYDAALAAFRQALAILREVGGRSGEGATLTNIGTVYADQRRYAEALEAYAQALVIRREVGDRNGEGATLNNIGRAYTSQGRYAEALEAYAQALVIRREVGDRNGEGATLTNIGMVYQSQGRYAEALEAYAQALDVIDEIRATAGSEEGRAGFVAQYAELYLRTAQLYHQQGQIEQAFLTSEHGRARAFLDSLATGYVQLADNEAQDLFVAEQEAYAARQATQDVLSKARAADSPDAELVADLEQQLTEAEEAYAAAQAAIEARGGELAALVPGRNSGVLSVAEVQALLDPATTLVSYFVGEDQTLVFILTHEQFETVALDISADELRAQVEALRAFASLDEAHPASAVQLYDQLIAPLREHLTTPHLAIVPHSVLHYLPFAALSDGERFLIDDYTLTVLPSASSLPFVQANSGRAPAPPLVLGNPASAEKDLAALHYAEQEAHAIASLYSIEPLVGAAATEHELRQLVGEAGILHLAAHGSFNPLAALSSVIHLAPSAPDVGSGDFDPASDGRLEVSEVYRLDLKASNLVVLSACETQLGDLSAGDELVGLTRAFIFAGTPSVLATLWNVQDESTSRLMERFYIHLREGTSKAEALRQAQLEVRAEYPNPYYWAGFVLSGDGGSAVPTHQGGNWAMPPTAQGDLPEYAWVGIELFIVTLWFGCLFVWHSKSPSGGIIGYVDNRPLYVYRPRFRTPIRYFCLAGEILLPFIAVFIFVVVIL